MTGLFVHLQLGGPGTIVLLPTSRMGPGDGLRRLLGTVVATVIAVVTSIVVVTSVVVVVATVVVRPLSGLFGLLEVVDCQRRLLRRSLAPGLPLPFRGTVSGTTKGAGTGVASVTGFPDVSLASGIGVPSSVGGTERPDVRTSQTVEFAQLARVGEGTITGNAGTDSGKLFRFSGFVLDASGNVRPCSIGLALRDVVPSEGTHNEAGVSGVRLRAIAGESGTGDDLAFFSR